MIFGQTQRNLKSRFISEIGMENILKQDNTAISISLPEKDNAVTEVHSSSLQQQLARNKRHVTSAEIEKTISYTAGERVFHKVFGEGIILSVTPMSNDFMLEIAFDKVGTKKVMANYTKPKKI